MKVSRYPLSDDLWNRIHSLVVDSLFSSLGFINVWRTIGGKPVCWLVEQNDLLLAVFPSVEFGVRPVKRLYAMPNGCYGRLFFCDSNTIDKREIAHHLLGELANAGYIKLCFYDFYGCIPSHPDFQVRKCYTTLVDISTPDWEPPNKKLRQQIHKAEREGIHLETFDFHKHFPQFLKLVKLSDKRIGCRTTYTPAFFEALAALAENDTRVRWIWCERDGEPVSSNIFIMEGDNLLHWQAYFNEAFSFLQPSKYIPFITARAAAQEGITHLNLGATPENAPGVVYYKSKWGGKQYPYNCYYRKSGLGKLV